MESAPFRSSISNIAWPAVPEPRASTVLALLFQLERTQWWSHEAHRDRQFEQLSHLVRHAQRTVPYYGDRLREIRLKPEAVLDSDDWSRLPLLRRSDIQQSGDQLVSNALPPDHGSFGEIYTSGSTGKPIRAVRSQLWGLFWSAFTLRDHLWHGRDLRGKLATIRDSGKDKAPYPNGTTAPNWGRSSSPVIETGPSVSLNITCTIEQQVDWLQREVPDYLLTHPSIAHRLAQYCMAENIRLPSLRQIETISEILRPATREHCREAWGVPVVDMYTAREAGYIALQCPEKDHYHIQAEGVFAEILDDDGQPCGPGEIGRVVVTPLHNFAMPLIRYEIGDYAEVGETCPCGRGLPVLRRILGRKQNMLVMPSGEERWPLLSSGDLSALMSLAPIRQYRFVQKRRETIELQLVVQRPLKPGKETQLRSWVRDKFEYPFEVVLTYHDEIPATAAGKFQDFISEVAV